MRPVSTTVGSTYRGDPPPTEAVGMGIGGGREGRAMLPPGARPRMVNSRRFAVDYAVDPARSAPGTWVELWGTADGGQSWSRVAVDRTVERTLLAEVAEDGLFGFRVLFRNGGPGDDPLPQAGDLPELWIGVETVPPDVGVTGDERR